MEAIDWELYDIVSVDLYRAKHNESYYAEKLKSYLTWLKPVAITEFGCVPIRGAADLGGNATFTILSFLQEEALIKGSTSFFLNYVTR